MKVSIIGGGGLVGSSAAFALQCGGIVSQIDLIDLSADQVRGQALDLLHGASLVADQRIRATGYEAIPESDVVIITAGLRRKPDESRLDLINRNVELFLSILGQICRRRTQARGDRAGRVQSGGRLDLSGGAPARHFSEPGHRPGNAARYGAVPQLACRCAQAAAQPRSPRSSSANTATAWSRSGPAPRPAGLPLERFPGWTSSLGESIFTRTRGSGAEVIKLKGGAGFAVGLSIREVVHALALDQKRILPVSTLVNGPYGLRDVCISIPTVIGRDGAVAQLEIELWPKEISALQHSAQVLKETIEAVKKSNPKADGKAKAASGKAGPAGQRDAVPRSRSPRPSPSA